MAKSSTPHYNTSYQKPPTVVHKTVVNKTVVYNNHKPSPSLNLNKTYSKPQTSSYKTVTITKTKVTRTTKRR